MAGRSIVDGRNVIDPAVALSAGFDLIALGRPARVR